MSSEERNSAPARATTRPGLGVACVDCFRAGLEISAPSSSILLQGRGLRG
jgi:hypothetical protein